MLATARTRLLAVVLLLAVHAALFPMAATQPVNPAAGVYPDSDEFVDDPDRYVGDRVVTDGFVQQTDPLAITVVGTSGGREMTVTDTGLAPDVGDKLRVFGTLTSPDSIDSVSAFVVPQGGLWYTWTVSFLAGLWVLFRLIRHWRVDVSRLSFHRRESPLSVRELLPAGASGSGGDDA